MEEKKYLSTGETARMLGVSKQTLIYYDKIGLLRPECRENETYRCYTLAQADELDTILTFRSLGVPIKRLKAYLRNKSPRLCVELLQEQEASIEAEIRRLSSVQKKIHARSRVLEQAIAIEDPEEVSYSDHPQEYYLSQPCGSDREDKRMESFLALCARAKELSLDFAAPVCGVIEHEDVLQGRYNVTSCYAIRVTEDEWNSYGGGFTTPAGRYASTCLCGSGGRAEAFGRLLNAIERDGLRLCGNVFTLDLFSTLTSPEPEDYMALVFAKTEERKDSEQK